MVQESYFWKVCENAWSLRGEVPEAPSRSVNLVLPIAVVDPQCFMWESQLYPLFCNPAMTDVRCNWGSTLVDQGKYGAQGVKSFKCYLTHVCVRSATTGLKPFRSGHHPSLLWFLMCSFCTLISLMKSKLTKKEFKVKDLLLP